MYLLNYINSNGENVIVFPDNEAKLSDVVKAVIGENIKYLVINNIEDIEDHMFLLAYKGDFSLESGAVSTLSFDINLGKEIFLNFIREKRRPLLTTLDVDFIRALEQGNTILSTEIANKKQQLRDITLIDLSSVTDLESLKALWPIEILGESPFKTFA